MGFFDYIRETQGEMKHVTWPTRRQVASFTVAVVIISLGTALFLGLFDHAFALLLQQII